VQRRQAARAVSGNRSGPPGVGAGGPASLLVRCEMTENDAREPRGGRVERRINSARDSLPGERNDLPDGALGGLPPDPQGDENRDPPPNAPSIPS
jgi:hypothetical protein